MTVCLTDYTKRLHSSLTEFSVTACLTDLMDAFHWGCIDLRNLYVEVCNIFAVFQNVLYMAVNCAKFEKKS